MSIPKTWNWRGEKRHLVSELKDGDEELVIYKRWRKSKQWWDYHIEPKAVIEFELRLIQEGKE